MKQEYFRTLINERAQLYITLRKDTTSLKEKDNISKRIIEIDQLLGFKMPEGKVNPIGWANDYLENIFTIGFDNIKLIFEEYFRNIDEAMICVETRYWGDEMVTSSAKFLIIFAHEKKYNLGSIRLYESLKFLYNSEYARRSSYADKGELSLNDLLKNHPDLIDYIWQRFFEIKNQNKTGRISIVKKLIEKNNQEQEVLRNPELRERRLCELVQEDNELDGELTSLIESLEEIEV